MPIEPFTIDSDIRTAKTLPADVYHDPEVFALQKERVFARTWQFVADARRLKSSGSVLPFTLLEGCLDEPLFLSRDEEGMLHALSNVCTHRGNLVVEGEGHVPGQALRCRYHGRRFGLDGCFLSMPEFDEAEDFPSPADDLSSVPLREWTPFLFCGLDPAMAFGDWLAPVRERVGWVPFDTFVFDAAGSHDYLVNANWALYVDNYLEGFHIPFVHASSLGGALDYGSYDTETFDYGVLQTGVASSGEPAFDLPDDHPDAGTRMAAYYVWLFPNLMLNVYPWGLSMNVVRPLGPERTKVSFLYFVGDDDLRDQGAGADLDRVEMEDEEIVEQVQRGVRSRLYDRGRYSPNREKGPHHFHRLLAQFLFADG